ncbi:hypothetical protein BH20ACI1_BH20ACI1_11870 [soil metagenome]
MVLVGRFFYFKHKFLKIENKICAEWQTSAANIITPNIPFGYAATLNGISNRDQTLY